MYFMIVTGDMGAIVVYSDSRGDKSPYIMSGRPHDSHTGER